MDGLSGKLFAKPKQIFPSIHLCQNTPVGELTINGNIATVRAVARSNDDVGACVDHLCINLAQYISLEIGLFVEAVSGSSHCLQELHRPRDRQRRCRTSPKCSTHPRSRQPPFAVEHSGSISGKVCGEPPRTSPNASSRWRISRTGKETARVSCRHPGELGTTSRNQRRTRAGDATSTRTTLENHE